MAPPPSPSAALVRLLRRSATFAAYRHAFETVTGLGLVLRIPGSFNLPLHGSRHRNRFCSLLSARSSAAAACLRCQGEIESQASIGALTLECHAGLVETLVPVRCGETVVAYLQTGQAWLKPGPPRPPGPVLRSVRVGRGMTATKLLDETYRVTQVVSAEQYESLIRLLGIFAEQLSTLAEQISSREAEQEAPLARKLRRYIIDHHAEKLSLGTVAGAMNMSAHHLCKTFRRLMGTNFTRYLAGVRIDAVKRQLVLPEVGITEVAFAAGFQSLSQFNRLFRRLTGKSPRHYRRTLRT
jgi:AraC-like DNA-binding protein